MIVENYFFGPLLFKTTVKHEDIEKIKLLFDCTPNHDYRKNLLGNLEGEFKIDSTNYQNLISKYIDGFRKNYENYYNQKCGNLLLDSSWVNFMKKGDYNPPHVHTKCDFSSVLTVEVPNELQKEADNYYKTTSDINKLNGPGSLQFCHGESLLNTINTISFEPKIGDFFMFPSWLVHYVNPFKCDGERITVAANFKILIK